ncbi:hypothetical protein Ciccas_002842 [Cichlidogyrus casuarinus]|uniref:Reverse transcriptase/retrotransposon-derived protein RNase H-like domain-containing protein n=1 Tax=Cichlidogyrus casuarinus TaxID=1844966 RepID=A0ABD2QGA6_9PLAT
MSMPSTSQPTPTGLRNPFALRYEVPLVNSRTETPVRQAGSLLPPNALTDEQLLQLTPEERQPSSPRTHTKLLEPTYSIIIKNRTPSADSLAQFQWNEREAYRPQVQRMRALADNVPMDFALRFMAASRLPPNLQMYLRGRTGVSFLNQQSAFRRAELHEISTGQSNPFGDLAKNGRFVDTTRIEETSSGPVRWGPADDDREFRLVCDASNVGIGGCVEQIVPNSPEPLAHFSRNLHDAETRYKTFGRELLAVDQREKFRRYTSFGEENSPFVRGS